MAERPRVDIDPVAEQELEDFLDETDRKASKKGIASEALRKGLKQMREEYGIETDSDEK